MKEVIYVFGALEEPDIEVLMRLGTRQQLLVGDQLLTEGTHPDAIYLVLEGELSVSVKGRDTTIAYVGKGRSSARCRCSNHPASAATLAPSPR
jgi:CRP-like cAMP-binding protein